MSRNSMFSIPAAPKRFAIVHVSRTTCWRNSVGRRTRPAATPRAVERMMRRLREKVLVGTEAARGIANPGSGPRP